VSDLSVSIYALSLKIDCNRYKEKHNSITGVCLDLEFFSKSLKSSIFTQFSSNFGHLLISTPTFFYFIKKFHKFRFLYEISNLKQLAIFCRFSIIQPSIYIYKAEKCLSVRLFVPFSRKNH